MQNGTPSASSIRRTTRTTVFPWRILVIAIVVFGLAVLIYAGMAFGYVPYLNAELRKVDAQFTELSQSLDQSQQEDLIAFYSQLYNIQSLGVGHVYPSKFFDLLERTTYPTVRLVNIQLDIAQNEVRMEGIALDYNTLANQVSALQADPNINTVILDSSRQRDSKDGGGVQFSLKVALSKTLFLGSN